MEESAFRSYQQHQRTVSHERSVPVMFDNRRRGSAGSMTMGHNQQQHQQPILNSPLKQHHYKHKRKDYLTIDDSKGFSDTDSSYMPGKILFLRKLKKKKKNKILPFKMTILKYMLVNDVCI